MQVILASGGEFELVSKRAVDPGVAVDSKHDGCTLDGIRVGRHDDFGRTTRACIRLHPGERPDRRNDLPFVVISLQKRGTDVDWGRGNQIRDAHHFNPSPEKKKSKRKCNVRGALVHLFTTPST